MGRIIKLSKRLVASGAMLAGAGVLAQGLFSTPAHAAVGDPECSSLAGVVFVSGSSAVKPVLAGLGAKLTPAGTTIVYVGQGSCVGVNAALGTPLTPAGVPIAGTYWDAASGATGKTCNISTSQVVDIGVSDVFATSCQTITAAKVAAAGLKDFDTYFAQVMNFVVPGGAGGSDQTAISAEAAYLTFGLGDNGATPWDNAALFAIRDFNSGTQTMLGKAIGLDATKWVGKNAGGSGTVFNDIKGRINPTTNAVGDPKKLIGILASNEADADTTLVKKLAFQATGQTCAYWPDSGVAEKDKAYVRDGHYPVWGPLHLLAKANAQGVPTNASAKVVLDAFGAQDQDILDLEINANVVPLCAMNVTRSEEVGPLSSIQPTGACGCYFDAKRKTGGAGTECKVCTEANAATVCTGARTKCNYGYCEVK